MERIKIFNDKLSIELSKTGAEMKSLKYEGKERLWDGNPEVWSGQAPLLFPICGGLKNDEYIYNGKIYAIPKHGFARRKTFDLESCTDNSAVFILKSNDETKKCYPFDFELRVIYTVEASTVTVEYDVKNTGNGAMYFSIGSHEAYSCPGGIENYSIEFEKEEKLNASLLDGNLLRYETVPVPTVGKTLQLRDEYFKNDAIVLTDLKSRSVVLKRNTGNERIRVDFCECPYLLLWMIPGAEYICIEPWNGIPDYVDSDCRIENKKGIIAIKADETKTIRHTISFAD